MSEERIEAKELKELLELHRKWLVGEEGGKRLELPGANLGEANLEGANLREANLGEANLQRADLRIANLGRANLEGADLWETNLRRAYLREANLEGAKGANLYECNWGELSDELTLEGMRKDAASHPDPKAFDRWAKGERCPYGDLLLSRRFFFQEKKELWREGLPTMTDWEFLRRILEEKEVRY